MEFDVKSIQEAGFDPEKVRAAMNVLDRLKAVDPEARENRIASLRALQSWPGKTIPLVPVLNAFYSVWSEDCQMRP